MGKSRAVAQENRCDCHPETCCCPDWCVMLDGKRLIGGPRESCKAVAAAMNTAFDIAAHPRTQRGGFDEWWGASKYCQVALGQHEQVARDAWNAALERSHDGG